MSDQAKHFIDLTAFGAGVATAFSFIPAVAGLVSIAWGLYRLYEIHLNVRLLKQKLKE